MRDMIMAIGGILVGTACATVPEATPERSPGDVEAYAALSVGAQWRYARTMFAEKDEATIRVVGQDGPYFVDNAGGALRITSRGLRDRHRYLIRTPLYRGARWKTVVSPSAVEHHRIVSVGTPCTVPAGTFDDCLTVETELKRDAKMSLVGTWVWARGVGLVRMETVAIVNGRRVPQARQALMAYGPTLEEAASTTARAEKSAEPGRWHK